MRVLFLTEGRGVPSGRFRAEQFLPWLRSEGIACSLSRCRPDKYYLPAWHKKPLVGKFAVAFFFLLKLADRLLAVLRAPFYDAVFLQRALLPWPDSPFLERLLRRLSRRLIFDFDDAIYLYAPRKIAEIIRLSDAVITGNETLLDYALKHNPLAELVPTCVDTEAYTPHTAAGTAGVTVGWMGTSIGIAQLAAAATGITRALRAGGAELLVVSDSLPDLPFMKEPEVRYRQWSEESELADLRSFDIGLMPLPDDEVARGKCGFKLLLYMSCGIPVVASPVGANREIVDDGKNGFLAASDAEWEKKLLSLILDPALRRRLGEAGRASVETRYSLTANRTRLAGIIKGPCR